MDLTLNSIQELICHKTKPNQTKQYKRSYFAENWKITEQVKLLRKDNLKRGFNCV